ncbi:MAG: ABC transporter ATP-binding protein [Massiliimalia sp.]|jgi:ABC-2 type transport system ATP-binding protein
MMEAVLRVVNLCKHYSGFTLENVSFSLAPKHIMGLIGKNGAGKSTTLKSILNIVSPESGSVEIFQKDFIQYEKEYKQRIGVVFGGIDFYPLKKLSTITAVTQKFYTNWDQEQYQKYIKRFALNEGKKFKELSNGMKVKYLLALALSHHAELLILDEPTSGLDPVSREELLHIFRQIVKNENCAILFSTHITSDLDKCADDITYIQDGRVLKSADKDTFLRSFEHLKMPEDTGPLTLEEIMLRTERSKWDDDTAV